jgi:hypothetical protein
MDFDGAKTFITLVAFLLVSFIFKLLNPQDMTKLLTLAIFTLLSQAAIGQQATRYVLLEHFTNSRCSVCASRNPAFFNTIKNYPDLVRHISIHPSIPYSSCVFYQANTADNEGRRNYYSVFSTPTVYMNGKATTGSQLITTAALDAEKGKAPVVQIVVSETTGNTRDVGIQLNSLEAPPTCCVKFVVAVVEKLVNYNAPNGEKEHHNVLRDFLTKPDGEEISLPVKGDNIVLNYSYTIPASWAADQVYVLAWAQNPETKEVLNAGTRFDKTTSSTDDVAFAKLQISPNPTSQSLILQVPEMQEVSLRIFSLDGKLWSQQHFDQIQAGTELPVDFLPSGMYLLTLESSKGSLQQKFVKE